MKKIQVFLRQCYYSKLQEFPDRIRPEWFNKKETFENFKSTLDPDLVDYTIVYDEWFGSIDDTFLSNESNVEIIRVGNEAESFIETINLALSKNFSDDQILYFLEDDYLHRPGWCDVMLEGFSLPSADYVTLYDFDNFISSGYLTDIFVTPRSHWKPVPGTTNTFACKYSTLKDDKNVHIKYSSTHAIKDKNVTKHSYFSKDYDKFWDLHNNHDKNVLSPIPGWSTHCDNNHLSPTINWKDVASISTINPKKQKNNFNEIRRI